MNEIQIKFTQEEIKMLMEIINVVNFQGSSIELLYPLKLKIKSALNSGNKNSEIKAEEKK